MTPDLFGDTLPDTPPVGAPIPLAVPVAPAPKPIVKLDWSPYQEAALRDVLAWYQDPASPQIFRLFGYAGTGKTTLAIEIAERVKEKGSAKVLFGAFTGKAALVMQSKGCTGARTIHSLIYSIEEDGTEGLPKFVLNDASDVTDANLLIIDECSMVGAELAHDLMSFGVKVLVLGDPAQLPPVEDAGFFTECDPDFMLTEVHRQAQGNPIIRLSMDIRAGKPIPLIEDGPLRIIERAALKDDPMAVLRADQVLVGLNATRNAYNLRMRVMKNIRKITPEVDEKLVCLRNSREKGLFNGGLWRVEKVRKANEAAIRLVLAPEDAGATLRKVDVKVHPFFFEGREKELEWKERKKFQEFTFGYALTVHKSQGSQWNSVMLFNESGAFRQDRARWLYTGVTRAAEKLTVVT
jgi:exodeoxyribonuclease-5